MISGNRPTIVRCLALSAPLLSLASCNKQAPPPTPPPQPTAPVPTAEDEAAKAEAEPKAPPRKVGEDALAVGVFNVEWAFDSLAPSRPKAARPNTPTKEEDWKWKRDRIVEILVAEQLDIVALVELGGHSELIDIATEVEVKGGPDYYYALSAEPEKRTGQHVALLSRFTFTDERSITDSFEKQVAADIELPNGEAVTVVAFQLAEGQSQNAQSKRRKIVRTFKKDLDKAQRERPVIALGTTNSTVGTTDDDYAKRTPGLLAGANTKREADDCADSADLAGATTVAETLSDRIFSCGLEMRGATVTGEDKILRETPDPEDAPWPTVPIDAAPFRDVSDHYVLWAEIARPKPPAPEKEAGATEKPAEG